jgi:predicted DCC family thiol-disulfide oxidoreductase YuxK
MTTDERDDRLVVVFDGDCRFCCRWIARLRRLDRADRLRLVAFQDPHLAEEFPALKGARLGEGIRAILPGGTIRVGADAVQEIARALPIARNLAWLYDVPGLNLAARIAYANISARRYRHGDASQVGSCSVH